MAGSRTYKFFQSAGLLNNEAPDLGELISDNRMELRAYCNGCRGNKGCFEKKVPKGTEYCPDCDYHLVWRLAKKRRGSADGNNED